jgi:phosphopantetheinyl transferase
MEQRPGEVRVWLIDMDQLPPLSRAAVGLLDDEEWAHIGALRARGARWGHTVGRVAAHRAVALVADVDPDRVRLTAGPGGRPVVSAGGADVNLSRSGRALALVASTTCRVGVDIEQLGDQSPGVPADAFSADERRLLRCAAADVRAATMLRLWTLKEALAKLSGAGLGTARLDRFDLGERAVGHIPGDLPVGDVGATPVALGSAEISLYGTRCRLSVAVAPNDAARRAGCVTVTLLDGAGLVA